MKGYQITLLTGEEEARLVHRAVTLGDHQALAVLLSSLGEVRRLRLLRHYRAIFGKKLTRVLEDNLAGDFLHVCNSVVSDPSKYLVKEIHELLMEFPAPREELLIAMLCERSSEELFSIRDSYQKRFRKSLVDEMESSMQADAVKWLKLLVTWKETGTCCDLKTAANDTQVLLTLGLGTSYGSEGPVLGSLIRSRCSSHLRKVFGELRRLGRSPTDLLEHKIPTDTRNTIIALMQAIDRPELFNARALWLIKSEPGRLWRTLLTIRLTRSKEFYKKVDLIFNETYNIRLLEEIKNDTSDSVSYLVKKLVKF